MKRKLLLPVVLGTAIITGCTANATKEQADTYDASMVNQELPSEIVDILLIMKAKVTVDNSKNKDAATGIGALLGAAIGSTQGKAGTAAGALIGGVAGNLGTGGESHVDGVSITYKTGDTTKTAVQAGRMCRFKEGKALKVMLNNGSARIQPNTECPPEEKKA